MNAAFTGTVTGFCLAGSGSIVRLGRRQTPWLQIVRDDIEREYLDYQLRILRRRYGRGMEVDLDTVGDTSVRLRVHVPELYHVWDLLYPRDRFTLSHDVLDLAGQVGLAQIWIDAGFPRMVTPNGLVVRDTHHSEPGFKGGLLGWTIPNRSVFCDFMMKRHGLKLRDHLSAWVGEKGPIYMPRPEAEKYIRMIRPVVPSFLRHYLRLPAAAKTG